MPATKAEVAEIRLDIAGLGAKDIAELGAKVDHLTQTMDRHLATTEDIAELRSYVKGLPTTWVVVIAIVAGQIRLTGVIAGALRTAARIFLHTWLARRPVASGGVAAFRPRLPLAAGPAAPARTAAASPTD